MIRTVARVALVALALLATPVPMAGDAATAGADVVPPVPEGTPEELLAFIKGLRGPGRLPRSPEARQAYVARVPAVTVEAADRILARTRPDDPLHLEAAKLKLDNLMMLVRLGDGRAADDLARCIDTLAESPVQGLNQEAERMQLVVECHEMLASGTLDAAPALRDRILAVVTARPDEPRMAGLAMQFAGACGELPGGTPAAIAAYEAFGPIFARSGDPRLRELAEGFAGTARRLGLPGRPLEIEGELLDGTRFDPATLAGKVVLVDFWATWCGPCRAEFPAIRRAYERFHDRGFEVVGVSIDEDRAALEAFVKDEGLPWPILVDAAAGEDGPSLARRYGVTGVPQTILVGRDGTVITLDARGPRLAAELERIFGAAAE